MTLVNIVSCFVKLLKNVKNDTYCSIIINRKVWPGVRQDNDKGHNEKETAWQLSIYKAVTAGNGM